MHGLVTALKWWLVAFTGGMQDGGAEPLLSSPQAHTLLLQMQMQVMQADSTACMTHLLLLLLLLHEGWKKTRREPGGKHAARRGQGSTDAACEFNDSLCHMLQKAYHAAAQRSARCWCSAASCWPVAVGASVAGSNCCLRSVAEWVAAGLLDKQWQVMQTVKNWTR